MSNLQTAYLHSILSQIYYLKLINKGFILNNPQITEDTLRKNIETNLIEFQNIHNSIHLDTLEISSDHHILLTENVLHVILFFLLYFRYFQCILLKIILNILI